MKTEETEIKSVLPKKTPLSFSIVYETENLSSVELENVYRSLDSISQQTISPEEANEFIIIDGGYAPKEVIESLKERYPWVKVYKKAGVKYYEGKMLGASLATGEIVTFLDSDCQYENDMLEMVLKYFEENPSVNVVTGETSTEIRNAYELAVGLHYFFPRYSGYVRNYRGQRYFLNNVSFRKEFLEKYPIPYEIPNYRGNCLIHSRYIKNILNEKIMTLPRNKTLHEPPQRPFIYWRYILMGRDSILREAVEKYIQKHTDLKELNKKPLSTEELFRSVGFNKVGGIIKSIFSVRLIKLKKTRAVLKENGGYKKWLPIALCYVIVFELLKLSGKIITCFSPDYLYKKYVEKIEIY